MNENNLDIPEVNDIEQPEDKGWIKIIKPIIVPLGTFVVGWLCGRKGKKDAYKKGWSDASTIYEKKFKALHDSVIKEKKNWKKREEECRALIADYESYIEELEREEETEENKAKISFFRGKRDELKKLEELG